MDAFGLDLPHKNPTAWKDGLHVPSFCNVVLQLFLVHYLLRIFFVASAQRHVDIVKLGDLVRERREKFSPQTQPDREFNYLSLANIVSGTGDVVGFSPVLGSEILSACKIFDEGNILYGRLRPYLNKVYYSEDPIQNGICSTEFYVLVPNDAIVNPVYLHAVMLSEMFVDQASYMQTGSTLPRITMEDLFEVKIPLPKRGCQDQCAEVFQKCRKLHSLRLKLARKEFRFMLMLVQKMMTGKSLNKAEKRFCDNTYKFLNSDEMTDMAFESGERKSSNPPRQLRKRRSRPI